MFEKLGKFQIQRVLGQGAMGEVYLGVDPAIGREVAIKTILPSAASGGEAKERFAREAKAAGVLNHPNLVTIYEFGEDQGVMYIAMEYVKGHDLQDLMRDQAMTRSEALEILAQVCDGLAFAHQNHIVHRDIKPANVRVLRDGKRLQAKVMDFGVARVGNSDMTATGMVMGTVSYMAPEYIRTGIPDSRSDLFALGVMLYECLSGRKPFSGDTAPTILYKIVNEPPEPIDLSQLQGISPAIRSVLDRALDKDPDTRFQTAEELAKALRAAKDPTWAGQYPDGTNLLKAAAGTAPVAAAGGADPTMLHPAASPTSQFQPFAPAAMAAPPPLPAAVPVRRPPPASGNTGLIVGVAGLLALLLLGGGGFALWKWKQGQSAVAQAAQNPAPVDPAAPGEPQVQPAAPSDNTPAITDRTAGAEATRGGSKSPAVPSRPRTLDPSFQRNSSRSGSARPAQDYDQDKPVESRHPSSNDPFARENLEKLEAPQRINLGLQTLSEATSIIASDPDKALQGLRNAMAANPREPRAYAWAVVVLYDLGRYRECRDVLNRAERQGIGRGQLLANARFRTLMNTENFNHKIPD
jgi:serine/threonine-protein kinase